MAETREDELYPLRYYVCPTDGILWWADQPLRVCGRCRAEVREVSQAQALEQLMKVRQP
jgi:hypothetical protein